MKSKTKDMLISTAVAGLMSLTMSAPVLAADNAANAKGHCVGANSCKGKGACGGKGHECAGKNSCKGKGFLDLTKADCDKLAANNPKIKFEAAK
ncbi:MAG: hypothetical protein COV44_04570 [Deltaproteobacteria bacterium CG11_big_fil_rev_8_21_14_0_20_45_16]|nr:MAG: hypothetical protein COV44_04570 [Deltaproteobacteria bacterium CG11_big_fil_rev_8_21_14_0_20_45_16]